MRRSPYLWQRLREPCARAHSPRPRPKLSYLRVVGPDHIRCPFKEIFSWHRHSRPVANAAFSKVAKADKVRPKEELKRPMQAGGREYPAPPFPKQHQNKPGADADLNPAAMYDAPFYRGSRKLDKKVALITGGDSGIGRAVAILFAREGADVAVAYLNEHQDARITKKKVEAEGQRCPLLSGDVSNQKFCKKAVAQTLKEFGQLDVLVNNAAFQIHTSRFEDLTARHFDETLKTNLYGYFYMAQAAVKHMKWGSAIINTGSVTGLLGNAGFSTTP
jgi:short chain dehydrogenase